jgi:hypothetical protein
VAAQLADFQEGLSSMSEQLPNYIEDITVSGGPNSVVCGEFAAIS